MRFATLPNGAPDGRLHLVSRDNERAVPAEAARTLQQAIERWSDVEAALEEQYASLNAGGTSGEIAFDPGVAMAPLPRAWQWLDGSAYDSHGALMAKVFGIDAKAGSDRPLMYQGVSDRFLGPCEDVLLPSAEDADRFRGRVRHHHRRGAHGRDGVRSRAPYPPRRADQRLEPAPHRADRDEDRLRLAALPSRIARWHRSP